MAKKQTAAPVQTSAPAPVVWTADGVPAGAPLSPREAEAVGAKYWFDREAADLACEFFPRYLVHLEGKLAGQPFELEDWQANDIIRPVFGWKRLDGSRRYRIVYIEIPRKNGKTTLAAGIALLLTFADKEPGAQIYSAASDKDQATIVFDAAVAMRSANHELRRRSIAYKKALVVPSWGASFKPLSTVAKSKHGFNVHGFVFDEFHVQPDRDLYDVLHTGTGARAQPLEVIITTAGHDRHSICWELHDHAIKVSEGLEDDAFLGVIYAAGEKDDWKDPATWRKANPNLGVSIQLDYIERECIKAQQVPAYENTFKRLHLNIWTEQVSRWIALETWDACDEVVRAEDLKGWTCAGGLDLSSVSDLSALVLDFVREKDGAHIWLPFFWMPKDNVALRVKRDRVPYDVWIKAGLIKATDGNVVDYKVIRADMNALADIFDIREVAFDRWNSQSLVTDLQDDGFTMVAFGQGFASMSAPTKELEKLILGKLLIHSGHPVLRWMLSNVAVQQDPAGNNKPDKEKSGEKIDGIVAGIMGLARNIVGDKEPKPGFAEL